MGDVVIADSECIPQGDSDTYGCNEQATSGGAGVTTNQHNMGKNQGTFTFTWDAYGIPDNFDVIYEGNTLFSTGSVSGAGSQTISYSGSSSVITVTVTGSDSATWWDYTVGCPQ